MKNLSLHLLGSVGVQGLGAGATFATGLAIAAWQGPEAQGQYGLVRTAADLLLALALFGLPQSLVHALNQRGVSAAKLERLGLRYAAVLMGAALVVCTMLAQGAGAALLPPWLGGAAALLALLAGCVGWMLQGLLRVLALCRGTALQFAWASVVPALTLLASVLVLLVAGSQRYELALAASGLSSAAIALWQLRPLRAQPGWSGGKPVSFVGLLGEGGHAFVQTVALALQAWITLRLMSWQGASVAELGRFVLAAHVIQAFALPTSFVAPLLFARISAAAGVGASYASAAVVGRVVAISGLAAIGVALLLPFLVPAAFGAAYVPAVPAGVLLALAGPLLVINRLGAAVLLGEGRFRLATAQAMLRALAVPIGFWLAAWGGWFQSRDAATVAAATWLLAEAVGVLMLAWFWKRLPRQREGSGS